MKITILETFIFDAKEPPFSFLGYWGCAFKLCPRGQRIVPGEKCHKFELGGDVDLAHPDCFLEIQKVIKERNELFPGRG